MQKSFLTPTKWLLLLMSCFAILQVQAQWNTGYRIGTQTGKISFNYNQVPDNLVELIPAAASGSYTHQWESSLQPDVGFTPISGATGSSYAFTAPIQQNTWFRKKATNNSNGSFVYSNTIRLELVSINWENRNYVREHQVLIPAQTDWKQIDQLPIGQKLQTTTYLDGMGRSIQQVSKATATPKPQDPNTWGDQVLFSIYDAYGRQPLQYLPYTTYNATEAGNYKTQAFTEQQNYYAATYNETNAFVNTTYDNSPFNRSATIKAPGTAWAAGLGNGSAYTFNTLADSVAILYIGYASTDIPVRTGYYTSNQLFKTEETDENGKKVVQYMNMLGQNVLTKTQIADAPTTGHTGWICVYSVYDDFGQLRFRIQPEGVQNLVINNWVFSTTLVNEQCFRYEYDEKGRNILKKAPGAKELRLIYDERDRVVFMQDGNQAAKPTPEWTANLYDELDRTLITTLYRTNKTRNQLQTDIDNATVTSTYTIQNPQQAIVDLTVSVREPGAGNYTAQNSIAFISINNTDGFTSNTGDEFEAEINPAATSAGLTITKTIFKNPISNADLNNSSICTIVKYNYYDGYGFAGAKPFNTNYENTQAYPNGGAEYAQAIGYDKRTLSHPTGSSSRVLGTNLFLNSTYYYDEEGRPIQTLGDHLKAGTNITTLQYSWDGKLLSTHQRHQVPHTAYNNFTILTRNVFDSRGRLNSLQKKYGNNNFVTIAEYGLDDVGRLKTKRLAPGYNNPTTGKPELETLTYSYNLHNNITGINKDYALKTPGQYNKWGNYFGLYLGYDNRDNVFANANLNGQVTGLLWTTQGDDAQRKYDYTYDAAGRLIKAQYNEKEKPNDSWNTQQTDFTVNGRNGQIQYDLNGNLLYMLQKGVVPGSAPLTVDDLEYSYSSLNNKLNKVTDAATFSANGKLGDFKDGSNANEDYEYDDNGNLVIDLNKEIKSPTNAAGIKYNFLDKPEEITIQGKGTLKIQYDANGNKLQKIFTSTATGSTKITTYIGQFVYEQTVPAGAAMPPPNSGGILTAINFEEGRIRPLQPQSSSNAYDALQIAGNLVLPPQGSDATGAGVFDYYIRDYQQNVRMILTQQAHFSSGTATMDAARAGAEEPVFGQQGSANEVNTTRFSVNSIPGQTSGGGWQNSSIGTHVSRLANTGSGAKIGPNSLLKVMAGDVLNATTLYYYQNPVTNGTGGNLTQQVLTSLLAGIGGSNSTNAVTKAAGSNIFSSLNNNPTLGNFTAPHQNDAGGNNPKAYLSVLFFDERFNFIAENSGTVRVTDAGASNALLSLTGRVAPKNGYAYIYVSNESFEPVYFDNLQVAHTRGRIIEENHYYAYGLKIAGISSTKLDAGIEGVLNNNYLYNDKELFEEADLDWYDYGFRNYDPQIGRFPQLDPLTDDYPYYTPYQYAGNEPIANVDLDGLEPLGSIASGFIEGGFKALDEVVVYSSRALTTAAAVAAPIASATNVVAKSGSILSTGLAILNGAATIGNTLAQQDNVKNQAQQNANELSKKRNTPSWSPFADALDNYTKEEMAKDDADRQNYWNGNYDLLSPEKLKLYSERDKIDEEWKEMNYALLDIGTMFLPMPKFGAIRFLKSTKAAQVLAKTVVAAKGGSSWLQGGKTFAQYKAARGGTETLAKISTSTGTQRISTEFHHVFLTQRMQKAYNLPNWAVNNRLNVWKLNTVQHSLIDSYRYNFLRAGFKPDVGWFGKYNWFTKF